MQAPGQDPMWPITQRAQSLGICVTGEVAQAGKFLPDGRNCGAFFKKAWEEEGWNKESEEERDRGRHNDTQNLTVMLHSHSKRECRVKEITGHKGPAMKSPNSKGRLSI